MRGPLPCHRRSGRPSPARLLRPDGRRNGNIAARVGDSVVASSALITNLREAERYYAERLGGMHTVPCHGRDVTLFFAKDTTHTYTEEPPEDRSGCPHIVKARLKGGVIEERVFSLERATLMDSILPAVTGHTYAMVSEGPPSSPRHLVHGQRLGDGRYLRVVLRWDRKMFYCLSAYPISSMKWMQDRGAACQFPP